MGGMKLILEDKINMSKKTKAKSKLKRRSEKAARKAAQRAKYESFMKAGKNTKSKRFQLKTSRSYKIRPRTHPNGKCGNVGCMKCHGIPFHRFLRNKIPYKMPQWMWLKFKEVDKEECKRWIEKNVKRFRSYV